MRICQIVNIAYEAGGAERSVRLIASGMRQRGHETLVIATDRGLGQTEEQANSVFADLIVPSIRGGSAGRIARYFWYPAAHRAITAAMNRFRPDVVHLHTVGEFSPAVFAATSDRPRVLTVHGPEDWAARLARWNLPSAANGKRLSAVDMLRAAHLKYVQRPAYLPRLRRIDLALAPSRFVATAVRSDLARVPLAVLPNGIRLPGRWPVPDTAEVLFVGRLEPVKGAHVLLEAFATVADRYPEARLTLVGDGRQRADLERWVARRRLTTRVRFTGWLSGDAVLAAYRAATVVVVPSIWPENFPTVVLDALGVGRAVLGSRIGGIPELVTDGRNGFLVPPADPPALADGLGRLLGDRNLVAAMAAESARRSDAYAIEPFLDRLENYYEKVSANHACCGR